MNKDGDIYAADNPPEEDVQRLKEWGDGIEDDELTRQREKFEEYLREHPLLTELK